MRNKLVSKSIDGDGKPKPLKLGITEKPSEGVKSVQTYPHMSQNKKFVHKALTFEQLTFPFQVAGEGPSSVQDIIRQVDAVRKTSIR